MNALLSNESINKFLLSEKCGGGRKTSPCPHDGRCVEQLGNINEARETIKNLREKFWNDTGARGIVDRRRLKLLEDLESFKVMDKHSGKITLQYKISGIFVCKKFFWVSNLFSHTSIVSKYDNRFLIDGDRYQCPHV